MVEKKAKRGAMMNLEKQSKVKEVVMIDQVASKERRGNRKIGFRLLLGKTWARRFMLTTVQNT